MPLHGKLLKDLLVWIQEHRLTEENYLFVKSEKDRIFKTTKKAHIYMGALLGKTLEDLIEHNISFYSGRHFYKTMLNLYNLGDIEELFMGHKVNRKVSERYNHKDKRGEKELLKEARRALAVIEVSLFR